MKSSETREIKIAAGYGMIAIKEWGCKNDCDQTVIALHGWMDNASTFDPLIESFTGNYHIIAVDLPGHGFSSHYPDGVAYRNISWIMDIQRIVRFYELEKFTLMGHSLGAALSLLYASIFPNQVECVISLDIIKEATFEEADIPKQMAKCVELFLDGEKRLKINRDYDEEQCQSILISAHTNGEITPKMADYLLRRAVCKNRNGQFYFTRDARLMTLAHQKFTIDYLANLYANMKCDLLIIKGSAGTVDMNHPHSKRIMDVHKSRENLFKLVTIAGDHYFHLSRPIDTARQIEEYLVKRKADH